MREHDYEQAMASIAWLQGYLEATKASENGCNHVEFLRMLIVRVGVKEDK